MVNARNRRTRSDRVAPRWIVSMKELIRKRQSGLGFRLKPPRGAKRGESRAKTPRRPLPVGSPLAKALAWSAHLYTAMGLVVAAIIAGCIVQGDPSSFRIAFLLMVVATIIDSTDGTFARRVRVKEVTPGFDGRRLDDLIDFLTYTCLPLFLIWRAELLPEAWSPWLLVPLLASAYGFCQVSIKTDDGYFLGFPSYWNLVAFYLYLLQPVPSVSLGLLLLFSALTFVPIRYLYPSQPGKLNRITVVLGLPWTILVALILWLMSPEGPSTEGLVYTLTLVSLAYPAYYMIASWVVSIRHWSRAKERRAAGAA